MRISLFIVLFCALLSTKADRPNMILILMDDMGYNDIGVRTYPAAPNQYPASGPTPQFEVSNPDADIPEPNRAYGLTPRIDSLAAAGMQMTRFYTSTVCGPSRSTLMTGRYQTRNGTLANPSHIKQNGLNTDEVTLPEILRENGYATAMIGKWHLGYSRSSADPFQYTPVRHGFQQFYGFPHSNDIAQHDLIHNETVLEADFDSPTEQSEITWRYTEVALNHIQQFTAEDKPFFLYLAHSMTHQPCWPSDREFPNADGSTWPMFLGSSGVSQYYDVIKEIDYSVGRILDKLDELDIADNTLVVFTSDNGPWLLLSNIDKEGRSVGSSYPLRGSKMQYWEGGVRVPFLVRWPGKIPAGTETDEATGLIDLLPTFVSVAGGSLPSDRTIDGVDLTGLWQAEPGWTLPRSAYATFEKNSGDLQAVVKGDWKLFGSKLYDLANDIQESTDLSASEPAIVADLESDRADILASIASENGTYGYATSYEVELSTNDLMIAEGGTGSVDIHLSANPGRTVVVSVSYFSGDSDLSVSSGANLTFTTGNWATPQTVTLTAAQDADALHSGATFRVTTDHIQPIRELFAFEVDDEADPVAEASLIWPKVVTVETTNETTTLVAEGQLLLGSDVNPAGAVFEWKKISGPGTVSFTEPTALETGVAFSTNGTYWLRFKAEHAAASGFNAADFTVQVGPEDVVEEEEIVSYKYLPLLAYDGNEDTEGDRIWENERGGSEWTLHANVTRTGSDPAPQLDFINSAFIFPGNSVPGPATSDNLDYYASSSATIELWFKPDSLPVSSYQVLWETGGDIGAGIVIEGSQLRFVVDHAPGAIAEAALSPLAAQDGFVHCVGVIDLENDEIRLFLDGMLVDTAAIPSVTDWCGNSGSGLGTIVDVSETEVSDFQQLGGNDLLSGSYGPFAGQVAHMFFYNQVLTDSDIADLTATGPQGVPVGSAPTGDYKSDPILVYDANEDSDGDLVWENEMSGRDWALHANVSRSTSDPAPQLDFINSAFIFPGTSVPGAATSEHFDQYSLSSASIEFWFNPDSLPVSASQVLWETGGNIGSSMVIEGSTLRFVVDQKGAGAIAEAVMSPAAAQDGFVHCVGVIDLVGDVIQLFIDGVLVDSAAIAGVSDWCGNSDSGLGAIVGQNDDETSDTEQLGGNDLLGGAYSPFAGQVAHMAFYNKVLSSSEIADLATGPRGASDEDPELQDPVNIAPVIFAGMDQSVNYADGAVLSGSVTDDGQPTNSSLSTLWRMMDGSFAPTFADENQPSTAAGFDLPGTYRLWLEVDDGEVKVYDEIRITVEGLSYSEWALNAGLAPGQDGLEDNPDGDSFDNYWEWVLGQDPELFDHPISLGAVSNDAGVVRFTFTVDTPSDRFPDFGLEASTNLPTGWDAIQDLVPTVQMLDEDTCRWTLEQSVDAANFPQLFIRMTGAE